MALSPNLNDLEKGKFFELAGEVAVRTSATGTFSPQGLNIGGKITFITLNSTTWTALPVTALPSRNAMGVHNFSGQTIYYQYDNSVGGLAGIPITNGFRLFWDIKETIIVYAKCESGTADVIVEELA